MNMIIGMIKAEIGYSSLTSSTSNVINKGLDITKSLKSASDFTMDELKIEVDKILNNLK